jgi:hypothetical protein
MAEPRLHYFPRGDATPEKELVVLATVYAHVLRHHDLKVAAGGADENITQGGHVGESQEKSIAREGSA